MLIKPPFFLVLAFLSGTLLSIYNTYRLFRQPQKVEKESLRGVSKLPKWYPVRRYLIKRPHVVNSRAELIFLIFRDLVMLIATAFLFTAWFVGK